jgi:hypothetical protein
MMQLIMRVLVWLMAGTSVLPLEDSRGSALLWQQLNDGRKQRPSPGAQANSLTPDEIAEGWIQLFDGQSKIGWEIEGSVKTSEGALVLGGAKDSAIRTVYKFGGDFEVRFEYRAKSPQTTLDDWAQFKLKMAFACLSIDKDIGPTSSLTDSREWTQGTIKVKYAPDEKTCDCEIAAGLNNRTELAQRAPSMV